MILWYDDECGGVKLFRVFHLCKFVELSKNIMIGYDVEIFHLVKKFLFFFLDG